MRPYRRKHHSSWRTRRRGGIMKEIREYLQPFVYCTKLLWKLEPPFPLTAKVLITAVTWLLLFLPLCYFLVPLFVPLFLFCYFSERNSLENVLNYLAEFCTLISWPKKMALPSVLVDILIIAFFFYDYYQILKSLMAD